MTWGKIWVTLNCQDKPRLHWPGWHVPTLHSRQFEHFRVTIFTDFFSKCAQSQEWFKQWGAQLEMRVGMSWNEFGSETTLGFFLAPLACFQFGMQQAPWCHWFPRSQTRLRYIADRVLRSSYDMFHKPKQEPWSVVCRFFYWAYRFVMVCTYLQMPFQHLLSALVNKVFSFIPGLKCPSVPHFVTQRVLRCDSKEMMDDLSGLGLRHVGLRWHMWHISLMWSGRGALWWLSVRVCVCETSEPM